jgi:hypothetical protein
MEWKNYIRIFLFGGLLYLFYSLGLSLYFIILIGAVLLLLTLLKGKLYKKLDNCLSKKFPFLSKLKPWVKKLIIVVIFILIYTLLKQIIFLVLKIVGIDIEGIISENINSINDQINK